MNNNYPSRIKIYMKKQDDRKISEIKSKLEKLYVGSTVNIIISKL